MKRLSLFFIFSFFLVIFLFWVFIFGGSKKIFDFLNKSVEFYKTENSIPSISPFSLQNQLQQKKELLKNSQDLSKPLDCKDDLLCLAQASKNCSLAFAQKNLEISLDDFWLKILVLGKIEGKKEEKCVFSFEIKKVLDFKFQKSFVEKELAKGKSSSEIEKEEAQLKNVLSLFLEGLKERYVVKSEFLEEALRELHQGKLPDFSKFNW